MRSNFKNKVEHEIFVNQSQGQGVENSSIKFTHSCLWNLNMPYAVLMSSKRELWIISMVLTTYLSQKFSHKQKGYSFLLCTSNGTSNQYLDGCGDNSK